MIEFDAGNISISLYLIITCASLSINSSAAKRLFTECNDKEYIGSHGLTRQIGIDKGSISLFILRLFTPRDPDSSVM